MSRRQRITERRVCTLEQWRHAKVRVEAGESKRSVAASLGMHEATLRKRLKRTSPAKSLGRYSLTFTPEMESELCEHIKKVNGMFYGLTTQKIREIAYTFAEINGLDHRFNKEKKMAGTEWLRLFMRRHPELSLRTPTSTSVARAIGFNKPQCDRYFQNLASLLDTYKFPAHAIYNMDETGISTVPNKPPKVISTKGKRCVNKISGAERGINVTLVNAVNAAGNFIPPAFIFPRKRMKAELLDGAPPSSIGMVSDTSYINSALFLDWLTHFRDHAKPSKDNPVLLILDNHTSHCTLEAVNFFRENHIHALTIPPHSSHKTQPLDRCIHNSLKIYYAAECEKWMRNHAGRLVTVYKIAQILTPAYLKAATPANAIQSFKISGIQPFNPDIFSEEDFLASAVTERPLADSRDEQVLRPADDPEPSSEQPMNDRNTGLETVLAEIRLTCQAERHLEEQGPERSPELEVLGLAPNDGAEEVGVDNGDCGIVEIQQNENVTKIETFQQNKQQPKSKQIALHRNENALSSPSQNSCVTKELSGEYLLVNESIVTERAPTPLACIQLSVNETSRVSLASVAPLPRAEVLSRSKNRKRGKSDT